MKSYYEKLIKKILLISILYLTHSSLAGAQDIEMISFEELLTNLKEEEVALIEKINKTKGEIEAIKYKKEKIDEKLAKKTNQQLKFIHNTKFLNYQNNLLSTSGAGSMVDYSSSLKEKQKNFDKKIKILVKELHLSLNHLSIVVDRQNNIYKSRCLEEDN